METDEAYVIGNDLCEYLPRDISGGIELSLNFKSTANKEMWFRDFKGKLNADVIS